MNIYWAGGWRLDAGLPRHRSCSACVGRAACHGAASSPIKQIGRSRKREAMPGAGMQILNRSLSILSKEWTRPKECPPAGGVLRRFRDSGVLQDMPSTKFSLPVEALNGISSGGWMGVECRITVCLYAGKRRSRQTGHAVGIG